MICKKCHRNLPSSHFNKYLANKPYLRKVCKDCQKKLNDDYRKTFNGKTSKAISNAKRKAKLKNKNISHSFTVEEWRIKLSSTNGICLCCGNAVGVYSLTIDHVIPLCEAPVGFTYTIEDVQPLCRKCNSLKGKCQVYF